MDQANNRERPRCNLCLGVHGGSWQPCQCSRLKSTANWQFPHLGYEICDVYIIRNFRVLLSANFDPNRATATSNICMKGRNCQLWSGLETLWGWKTDWAMCQNMQKLSIFTLHVYVKWKGDILDEKYAILTAAACFLVLVQWRLNIH